MRIGTSDTEDSWDFLSRNFVILLTFLNNLAGLVWNILIELVLLVFDALKLGTKEGVSGPRKKKS